MKEMNPLKPKKSLGQNFLRDTRIISEILRVAHVQAGDRVLEIGPGDGALTAPLLMAGANVKAIEFDAELVERLGIRFQESDNLSLLEGNILELDLGQYLAEAQFEDGKYKVVANIPYYITAPIIRLLLSLSIQPERIVLMVQDEVAERLAARPGKMSIISVMAQYYSTVTKEVFVPKTAFFPMPKVDSSVVRLVPKRRFSPEDDRRMFRVVRAGFAARRKVLVNNLSSSFQVPKEAVEAKLIDMGLSQKVRAQELQVEDWEALADFFAKK